MTAAAPPPGERTEECSDPERLAAHRAEHGAGSVEFKRSPARPWERSNVTEATSFSLNMGIGWRYRLVHPEPPAPAERGHGGTFDIFHSDPPAAPAPLPPGVTRHRTADGTECLVALGRDARELRWEWQDDVIGGSLWCPPERLTGVMLDEVYVVRPPVPPAEPRTERVPWWQAGDRPVYVKGECFGSISEAASNGCVPPIDLDGTVEVLAEPTEAADALDAQAQRRVAVLESLVRRLAYGTVFGFAAALAEAREAVPPEAEA